MDTAIPQPTPGPELAALRRRAGVTQVALAARLGLHRVTLNGWEGAAAVDAIRAARYQRAVEQLVAEATSGTAA